MIARESFCMNEEMNPTEVKIFNKVQRIFLSSDITYRLSNG